MPKKSKKKLTGNEARFVLAGMLKTIERKDEEVLHDIEVKRQAMKARREINNLRNMIGE